MTIQNICQIIIQDYKRIYCHTIFDIEDIFLKPFGFETAMDGDVG
jgi:hypothetical protein